MPYEGNETLAFRSNTGKTDTIFLLKKVTYWHYPYPATDLSKYQEVAVFCKHSDPYMPEGGTRYIESPFFEIKKKTNNQTELKLLLVAKDAVFYRLNAIKIDSLNRLKPLTFQTTYGRYNDVYVIQGEDYLGSFRQRSNFVTQIYWSKSKGLVRYNKKDTVFWELVDKQ